MIITVRRAKEAMSAAPPLPGSRTCCAQVVLRLPKRSISAPPIKPTSMRPRCKRDITSRSPVQASAAATLGGSPMVTIGPSGPWSRISPFSKTPTADGACNSLATAKATSGRRMPTNTTSPSRTSRAAAAIIISRVENNSGTSQTPLLSCPFSPSPALRERARVRAYLKPVIDLTQGQALGRHVESFDPLLSEFRPIGVTVRDVRHPFSEPGHKSFPVSGGLVVAEKVSIITLPKPLHRRRVRTQRFRHHRVYQDSRNEGAVRVRDDYLPGDHFLTGEDHPLCRIRRLDCHPQVSPQVGIAKRVSPLNVEDGNVRHHRFNRGELLHAKGTGDWTKSRLILDDVTPPSCAGWQERDAESCRFQSQGQSEVRVVLHRDLPRYPSFDRPAKVVAQTRPDIPHPGSDDFFDTSGANELVKKDIGNGSHQGEILFTLPYEFVPCGKGDERLQGQPQRYALAVLHTLLH